MAIGNEKNWKRMDINSICISIQFTIFSQKKIRLSFKIAQKFELKKIRMHNNATQFLFIFKLTKKNVNVRNNQITPLNVKNGNERDIVTIQFVECERAAKKWIISEMEKFCLFIPPPPSALHPSPIH